MKIATLGNASVIHLRRWVEYFRALGHEVRVWSLEPGPASLAAESLPRAPLPGFLRYPLATGALRRALEAFRPDLVDAHYVPNYGLLGVLAGARPLSVAAWGSDLLVRGSSDPVQRARARFVLARADLVITDSGNLAAAARALGAAADRVHAIPWGVDLARFAMLPPREPGLLVSARMHEPVYDLRTIIEGARPILERHPEARLVIAGDGSQRALLERLAEQRLPAGRFRFVGMLTQPEMAEWLGRADLFLSGSHSDSTSVSLLEAMAAGAVPVVSDIDGNREWVAEGDGARLFAAGDAAGVSAALERALADPAWRVAARARNRTTIEHRAVWETNMRRIASLFEATAAGRGADATRAGGAGARS